MLLTAAAVDCHYAKTFKEAIYRIFESRDGAAFALVISPPHVLLKVLVRY